VEYISVGDLVQFDLSHAIGIVTKIKPADAFDISENITDIKVHWVDGEEFWCLNMTLKVISKNENY
jgi:hypothetical protein